MEKAVLKIGMKHPHDFSDAHRRFVTFMKQPLMALTAKCEDVPCLIVFNEDFSSDDTSKYLLMPFLGFLRACTYAC